MRAHGSTRAVSWLACAIGVCVIVAVLRSQPTRADFIYVDFNDTTGLLFNQNSTTTSCDDSSWYPYAHSARHDHGYNDRNDNGEAVPLMMSENTQHATTQDLKTDDPISSVLVGEQNAIVGHRDDFVPSPPRRCPVRVRLTPSRPFSRGSVWRAQRESVLAGFETGFSFQMSDHSRSCTNVKDRNFNTLHHQSCMVHGADGFAFVLHSDPAGYTAVGDGGKHMGYGGLRKSIAVEFDTWYNPEVGDLFTDHVSIQTSANFPNSVGQGSRMGVPRPVKLADGRVHLAKIAYYRFLKFDLLPFFTGSSSLLQFLKDNGEARRVGTLVVWVDDMSQPLMAIPINLSIVLDNFPQGQSIIGFTSATGRSWEKHDLLSWYFCEMHDCPRTNTSATFVDATVDYHQQSKLWSMGPVASP